ncbi:MAG: hypothetical protein PWQ12_519 [Clostridiales bacterium]|jgi:cation diffusion facilitator family transporter|nr:hypothetical protein [Clostridiales bacterium]
MIKWLIRKTVKNYQSIENKDVRESYGVLSGSLGIACNMTLFSIKLFIGLAMNSIAVISDAFNNLTDIGSSVITVLGAKMSNRKPDAEHPFGHGRFEYVASLVISFVILLVGFELFRDGISKILSPETLLFNPTLMIILALSILIKLWMFSYNRYIGEAIQSSVNKATASDSLNDVYATTAVVLSTLIGHFFNFPIDGFAGVVVSVLILKSGLEIAKDTIDLLLGMSPSQEVIDSVISLVMKNPVILDVHDLRIHDYGPGRAIASAHVVVDERLNLVRAHTEIDHIEKRVMSELGIDLVLHVDPSSAEDLD